MAESKTPDSFYGIEDAEEGDMPLLGAAAAAAGGHRGGGAGMDEEDEDEERMEPRAAAAGMMTPQNAGRARGGESSGPRDFASTPGSMADTFRPLDDEFGAEASSPLRPSAAAAAAAPAYLSTPPRASGIMTRLPSGPTKAPRPEGRSLFDAGAQQYGKLRRKPRNQVRLNQPAARAPGAGAAASAPAVAMALEREAAGGAAAPAGMGSGSSAHSLRPGVIGGPGGSEDDVLAEAFYRALDMKRPRPAFETARSQRPRHSSSLPEASGPRHVSDAEEEESSSSEASDSS